MIKEILEKKSPAIQALCRRHQIGMLILFGSCASAGAGCAHKDMDIAIQPGTGSLSKLHLIQELESIFEHQQIDLTVITKNTDPLLLFEIFSNGQPLFQSIDGLFDSSRLKAWHLYLDTMPLRQLERTCNEKRIRALSHVT